MTRIKQTSIYLATALYLGGHLAGAQQIILYETTGCSGTATAADASTFGSCSAISGQTSSFAGIDAFPWPFNGEITFYSTSDCTGLGITTFLGAGTVSSCIDTIPTPGSGAQSFNLGPQVSKRSNKKRSNFSFQEGSQIEAFGFTATVENLSTQQVENPEEDGPFENSDMSAFGETAGAAFEGGQSETTVEIAGQEIGNVTVSTTGHSPFNPELVNNAVQDAILEFAGQNIANVAFDLVINDAILQIEMNKFG